MDPNTSASQRKKNATLPPKRGKIKAQIFESFSEAIASLASKAGEAMKKTGKGVGGDGTSSASETPQTSAYNSDKS